MDSDGQDKGDNNGTSPEVSPFDLPRMGSPFEPTRLGSFFARSRNDPVRDTNADADPDTGATTDADDPIEVESTPAEVAAEPAVAGDDDQPAAEAEGERVVEPPVDPVVADDSSFTPSAPAEVGPEPEIEVAAEEVPIDSLDEDLGSDADDDGSDAELEADVEPHWQLDVESEPAASEQEPVEAEPSDAEAIDRFDDESFEDEVDAEVIEFASYVEAEAEDAVTAPDETGADVIELDADGPLVASDAQVIDLTADPQPAEEPGADVIDVEFQETNIITLGPPTDADEAQQEGPAVDIAAVAEAATDTDISTDDEDDQEFGHESRPESEPQDGIDEFDRSPAVPMYSVGAAIDILDSESDDADELLQSEDAGLPAREPSVEDIDIPAAGDTPTETNEPVADARDDVEPAPAETGIAAEAEATTTPGMPTLDDLRTMALDLDDIDSILERLDNDPDSLDLDAPPPVEQTLDLSLSD